MCTGGAKRGMGGILKAEPMKSGDFNVEGERIVYFCNWRNWRKGGEIYKDG